MQLKAFSILSQHQVAKMAFGRLTLLGLNVVDMTTATQHFSMHQWKCVWDRVLEKPILCATYVSIEDILIVPPHVPQFVFWITMDFI